MFLATTTFCQTVALADTNLRNKLLSDYPQVMQGDELLIDEAGALMGALNLNGANIVNASGVEYFTNILSLNLSNNQLTFVPNISGITGLRNFYASNNLLESLPDMSALTQLRDFQVMNNKLTALPAFSNPSLLRSLFCSRNNIKTFPPLAQFPNIINLVIGENEITSTLDFTVCPNLEELHVHQLHLDTIVGLEKLTKLRTLFAWDNKIKNFSGLDSITTLDICVIFDNPIHELFYLGNKPLLNQLQVQGCYLTFEDLASVHSLPNPLTTFIYASQEPLFMEAASERAENDFHLHYPVTSPLSNNTYVWSKNGEVIDSAASPSFAFTPLIFADSGNYALKIYNPDFPMLTLTTNTFRLDVLPCLEADIASVDIISQDCSQGYTLDMSNLPIAGGTPPFSYTLNNGIRADTYNKEQIQGVIAGTYELTISDSKKCSVEGSLTLDRIKGCDPVLTPNNDGIMDYYYFETPGTVKIYDFNRKLVNTLQAPVSWDGTDMNGNLLDAGYYIVLMENHSPFNITLIR